MGVRQINQPQYTIDTPGFEDCLFTESSNEHLSLPSSVKFAQERHSVLQSAREAWAFRLGANGTIESDKYQSTRTAALGVKINGIYYIAIDDSNDPAANILLARPQEGYDAHTNGSWLLPKNDPAITTMLDRAQHEHRLFPALENTLICSTGKRPSSTSAYGGHAVTQAILGRDLAEPVATYLRQKGFTNGYVWTLSPSTLKQLGVDNDHVEVRRVGVGGDLFDSNSLGADGRCYDVGRARGVRKNSTGNKG